MSENTIETYMLAVEDASAAAVKLAREQRFGAAKQMSQCVTNLLVLIGDLKPFLRRGDGNFKTSSEERAKQALDAYIANTQSVRQVLRAFDEETAKSVLIDLFDVAGNPANAVEKVKLAIFRTESLDEQGNYSSDISEAMTEKAFQSQALQ